MTSPRNKQAKCGSNENTIKRRNTQNLFTKSLSLCFVNFPLSHFANIVNILHNYLCPLNHITNKLTTSLLINVSQAIKHANVAFWKNRLTTETKLPFCGSPLLSNHYGSLRTNFIKGNKRFPLVCQTTLSPDDNAN